MYPANDTPILLHLAALRTRALHDRIHGALSRIRALCERAERAALHLEPHTRVVELTRELHDTVRTSRELVETAREQTQQARVLVQRSRHQRLLRADEEPA